MYYLATGIRKNRNRSAMTFVELALSLGIGMMVFMMVYRFMSGTRQHYMYGTVNLQNLQEARLAINYLRRDFSSACPRIDTPVDEDGYVNLQKIRNQIFMSGSVTSSSGGELMQVVPGGLSFHRFNYGSPDEKPLVELVQYVFDPTAKTLSRQSETGAERIFTGIEEAEFALYTHQLNPKIPLLWVKLKVHEGENTFGTDEIGNALEITTTVASSFVASSLNNKYWRYEIGHKKL